MKKRTVVAFVVIAFVAGLLCSNLIPRGLAVEKDSIDRTPFELFPAEQYPTNRRVRLYYEDKYYHEANCPFIVDMTKLLIVSRYEAVERGFLPCPNCCYEKVVIK